ncbi:hypothetical protein V7X02_18915 [Bacillus altitudinis]|uniref:hypothetical protein n=1 Tax=Bacillus altitudinis TaxID=293387 RepID=UPI0009637BB5|nr:hypothetical protein [Bacillus altitudinis]MBR0633345.1 hypothetical protein [Bacillus altitudinis C101]MCM3229950.1 hypothetical protein [Bacillus altitudinis]QSI44975.1 hypothetical protein I4W80_02320 [Bacillus altitudinis]SIT94557.1 hypothetical protein SAMN05216491_3416 [Bacillus altitudinis]
MSVVSLFRNNISVAYDSFISSYIKDYWHFMEFTEEQFEKRESEYLNSQSDEELSYYKKEGILEFVDPMARDFERMRRYSFLVTIHSLLEEYVVDYCKVNGNSWSEFSAMKKNKGKGTLIKVQLYISNELKEEFPNNNEWKFIRKVNSFRNEIIHNGGDLNRSPYFEDVTKKIKNTEGISIGNHNMIILDKNFCFNYLKAVDRFLSSLYKN